MPSAAEVERLIRKTAADAGVPQLANMLVAIARRESGLGQNNVGDGGNSIGPFQENINGRGKGLSREQRLDPVASTKRAIAEIKTVMKQNPGADPGTIAVLAQRPREDLRANYRADINAQVQRTGAQAADGTRPSGSATTTALGRTVSRQPSLAARLAAARARTVQGANTRGAVNSGAFKGTYVMPVDGTVTNAYGGKQTYSEGKTSDIGSINNGVDIATKAGTEVRAPVGGVVKKIYDTRYDDRKGQRNAEENSGWGGQVVITGDDGKEHRLSHAQYGSIAVKEGQRVEAGQPTHKVGMSGNATGPHVDWEKWSGGKSEDALKSALMPSSAGGKAYQEAIARQKAAAAARPTPDKLVPGATPTPDKLNPDGTPQRQDMAGGTDVGDTAGAAGQPNAVVAQAGSGLATMYQGLLQTTENKLVQSRTVMDELQRELSALQFQAQNSPKDRQGNTIYPPGVKDRIDALQGPKDKPGTGLIGKQLEVYKDLEQTRDEYLIHHAAALETSKGKAKTPEELEHDTAVTAKIKAETEALRKRLDGTDPDDALARENIQSQIAAREAEIVQRDRAHNIQAGQLKLEADRNPSVIRGTNARAAVDEFSVIESMEMLPYNIDRILAATDVDIETANKLRETLPAVLEGMWTDIWAKQLLTPQELELGKANTDLTRQRANEIRGMLGPNVERTLSAAGVDRANIAKIVQMLPLEIADLTSQTQFRNKQTELLGVTAGKTGRKPGSLATRPTRKPSASGAGRPSRSRSERTPTWARATSTPWSSARPTASRSGPRRIGRS